MLPHLNPIDQVDKMRGEADRLIAPIRQSIFRRFPTFFTFLVTFGIAATFFGIERVLALTPLFNDNPWFVLGLGLLILMITGKLYAKLG